MESLTHALESITKQGHTLLCVHSLASYLRVPRLLPLVQQLTIMLSDCRTGKPSAASARQKPDPEVKSW